MDALDETERHPTEQLFEARGDTAARPGGTSSKDNRSLFIEAMDNPIRRRIAFDVVERNCRLRFRIGKEGVSLYLQVLTFVQSSKVNEAVDEFEKRFVPMLDQRVLKKMVEEGHTTPT